MRKTIKIEELRKLCEEYDTVYGSWPESRHEGEAVLDFVLRSIEMKN